MNTNEYSKTGNEGLVSNEDRFNLSRKREENLRLWSPIPEGGDP
jgi:hypothetical protein